MKIFNEYELTLPIFVVFVIVLVIGAIIDGIFGDSVNIPPKRPLSERAGQASGNYLHHTIQTFKDGGIKDE